MDHFPVKMIKNCILAILICLLPVNVSAQDQIIKIGALANRGHDACLTTWGPTATYLTKKIPPYTFRIVPLSFEEIKAAVQNQRVDFVICNPGIYVEIEALYGAGRIATVNNKVLDGYYSVFGGVIFTREDNRTIYALRDLKGKRFVAVDPDSFGGWLAARRELNRIGIDPSRDFTSLAFAGQQDKVVDDVLSGKADAGAVRTDILERMIKAGNLHLQDIRVLTAEGIDIQQNKMEFPFLLSTRLYPEWPIAKLIKTPNDLATQIAVALMSMDRHDPAAIAAESGGWTYPMNYQIVHELMMELKLGYYGKLRQPTLTDLLRKYWLEALAGLLVFLITSYALLSVLRLNRRLTKTKKKLDIEFAEREKIQAEIQRSEEQHRLLIERLSLAVFVHTQGKIVYANPAFLTLFKASSPDEVIGMRLIEFVSTEFFDTVEERRRIMTEEKRILPPLELNIRCLDGTIITVVSTPMPILFQEQDAILTAFHDITERKRGEVELQKAHDLLQSHVREIEDLQAKLKEQAIRDPLTGLFNRRYLEETLGRELARAAREGFPIGMIMIDVDHFKQVNDTHGHKAGDLILQALGNLLLGGIRAGDIACRYGGEEFLLILPQASKAITAERAEQWRTGFEALNTVYGEKALQATISLGVAVYPADGATAAAVIHAADQAMYRAKALGRNRVVLS